MPHTINRCWMSIAAHIGIPGARAHTHTRTHTHTHTRARTHTHTHTHTHTNTHTHTHTHTHSTHHTVHNQARELGKGVTHSVPHSSCRPTARCIARRQVAKVEWSGRVFWLEVRPSVPHLVGFVSLCECVCVRVCVRISDERFSTGGRARMVHVH
jgi:hypothetical protein